MDPQIIIAQEEVQSEQTAGESSLRWRRNARPMWDHFADPSISIAQDTVQSEDTTVQDNGVIVDLFHQYVSWMWYCADLVRLGFRSVKPMLRVGWVPLVDPPYRYLPPPWESLPAVSPSTRGPRSIFPPPWEV